tara:strand:+ start:6772 stop:7014 length:243 start_codon:yes stop_codon:yes gene_type:complete
VNPKEIKIAKPPGLYANIAKKRARIKAGSGEKMRSVGDKGAPTAQNFKDAAKTAKMAEGGLLHGGCGAVMKDRKKKTKYR